ncbi:hypothetical protein DUNSADRAFT_834 [Dunaliella salina]|uniref:COG complex component COG2 C-terminal domain-containing protein n=1 Tax=Dunaliella salina TaxID=3046 RepID=A0ABQ7GXU9_DUNSA|nr:hypothetical protein DUNSADRAFT_834 [Dunaliella salina]|eukprot:KAF5839432.1 hypothetical protein DUNSADRAFT_834 [Dunaliella salina]
MQDALRTVVVAPIVASHLAAHKAAGPVRGGASIASGEGTLAHLFTSILESVLARAGPLLSASLAPQSPLRGFDFLSNSVLAEVNESVSAALPGAFSPGVPPAFHANYLAAQRFLDALEVQCHSRTALDRLRASPHYASFMKKWNTSIYFSLIYQDIAGELEDAVAVAKPDLRAPPSGPASVSLPASVALVACLDRATAPNVYLPHVADSDQRIMALMKCALVLRLSTRLRVVCGPGGLLGLCNCPQRVPAPRGRQVWHAQVSVLMV